MPKPTNPNSEQKTALQGFFNSLADLEAKREFMRQVCSGCSISIPTFYLRLKRPYKYSSVEQKFIARLAGLRMQNIFPKNIPTHAN